MGLDTKELERSQRLRFDMRAQHSFTAGQLCFLLGCVCVCVCARVCVQAGAEMAMIQNDVCLHYTAHGMRVLLLDGALRSASVSQAT
jgi:hypothetical protein